MKKVEKEEIIQQLIRKGVDRPCPRCGNDSVTLVDGYFNQTVQDDVSGFVIGGTSMGSVMAACHARGWSPEYILEEVSRVFAASRAVIDLTLPMASLLAGTKLDRILQELFGGIDIEDLWTPFFCVSSSVSHWTPDVASAGPNTSPMRSSTRASGRYCSNDVNSTGPSMPPVREYQRANSAAVVVFPLPAYA